MPGRLNQAFAICVLLGLTSTAPGAADTHGGYVSHHAEIGFRNPYAQPRDGGFFSVLYSRLFTDEWQSYDPERDQVATAEPEPATGSSDNATVTWIGHATVLIQHQGINVLSDPMFSDIASPVPFIGPKRITQPAIAIDDLPEIHIVVISHDHYDHLDTQSVRALGDTPVYFVPLGLRDWFLDAGISGERVVEMDWWDAQQLTIGGHQVTVTATPSQHFSGRGLTDRNRTLWASWNIAWSDFGAWFGGDTGYNDLQFKEIGERMSPIDLAIIPIGAYEPRRIMGPIHVNPAEAVLMHQDLDAAASMAIHWGAFILSAEGVLAPIEELAAARAEAGLTPDEFAAFAVGETRHYATDG